MGGDCPPEMHWFDTSAWVFALRDKALLLHAGAHFDAIAKRVDMKVESLASI